MYRQRPFAVDDVDWCVDLARAWPFATVVAGPGEDGPTPARIGHVPTVVGDASIDFHVAVEQPLASLEDGDPLVIVFQGPHSHVSASWYGEPTRQVPTWNYLSAHATGTVHRLGPDELLAHLGELTTQLEGIDGWDLQAARAHVEQIVSAATGFRLHVDRWEGIAKLSQNRSADDRHAVGVALRSRPGDLAVQTGDAVLAELDTSRADRRPLEDLPLADFELRPVTEQDRDLVLDAVRASRELFHGWGGPPATVEAWDEWIQRVDPEVNHRNLAFFRGELVGMVSLQNIVRGQGQYTTLGYSAFLPHAGRGRLRRAVALGIDLAFGDLDLHRVEAGVMPHNLRSIEIVRSLGFVREGLLQRLVQIEGEWRDHELWSMIAEDWPGADQIF